MPTAETVDRYQKAVLWAKNGVDDSNRVKLDAASEIYVRWIDKKSKAADPHGNTISVDVTLVVNQELAVGSIVAKGAEDDYVSTDMKYEVVIYNETPDLLNRAVRRTAGLRRYGTELPELA